jgi:hypothetical protein
MKVEDLTIIYYTSNELDRTNPYFLENTKKQLLKAVGNFPIVIVSHKPTLFGNSTNICLGEIGRSHLNLYKQILIGCKEAKTKYVAMAEDDILYSYEHFHQELPRSNYFLYDMNKWSIFTWSKPPQYSFRDRRVVNQLIAPRDYLISALEERFDKVEEMKTKGMKEQDIIKYWGDPGRYEKYLRVSDRKSVHFFSSVPSIVFTHENAFGYLNHSNKKKLGNPKAYDIPVWGKASEIMKLYDKNTT